MRKVINYILLIFTLTFLILISYGRIPENIAVYTPKQIEYFLYEHSITEKIQEEYQKYEDPGGQMEDSLDEYQIGEEQK